MLIIHFGEQFILAEVATKLAHNGAKSSRYTSLRAHELRLRLYIAARRLAYLAPQYELNDLF
jgi:hypothetical protein